MQTGFAAIEGIGWGRAGVIWLYNLICHFPLDTIKFTIRYALSGKAWDLLIEQRVRLHSIYNINNLQIPLASLSKRLKEKNKPLAETICWNVVSTDCLH